MSSASFKVNNAQQRVLRILLVLAGNEGEGVAQSAVARAIKATDSRAFNDLRNLAEAGFAEKLSNGNWRLAPKAVQIAIAHMNGLARLKAMASEIEQRYSRDPH